MHLVLFEELDQDEASSSSITTSDGAHDLAHYDFWKDVRRVEQLVEARHASWGAVIAITDDPSYWTPSRRQDVLDTAFRLHEGREAFGVLAWARQTGTTKGRTEDLALAGWTRCRGRHTRTRGGSFGWSRWW